MAEDTPIAKAPIAFSDSIGIGAFVFAMIAFAFLPTWWLRLPPLLVAIAGLVFLIYRSLWTHAWNPLTKVLVAVSSSICLLAVGISQIVDQLKTENRWQPFVIALFGLHHGLARVIASPWTIRYVYVLAGMVLVLLYQWARRRLSSLVSKRALLIGQDKGLLDYRIQIEESIHRVSQVVDELTQITLQSTASTNSDAEKKQAVYPATTKAEMELVRESAKAMNKYSRLLDAKGVELERIGGVFSEGVAGWLFCLKNRPQIDTPTREILEKLQMYTESLEKNVASIGALIELVAKLRGESQVMNAAVGARVAAHKRIREATENIRLTCANGLKPFGLPVEKPNEASVGV
jgi:hypothetical protein